MYLFLDIAFLSLRHIIKYYIYPKWNGILQIFFPVVVYYLAFAVEVLLEWKQNLFFIIK